MLKESVQPQVIYSLTAMSDALYELMGQKPFSEITITDICERAGVSRKTFYRHCRNREDLISYYISKQIDGLMETVEWSNTDAEAMYRNFFHYWLAKRHFLTRLREHGFFPLFAAVFIDYCSRKIDYRLLRDALAGRKDREQLRLFHNAFIVGGLCQLLHQWTEQDFRLSIDDMTGIVKLFSPTAVHTVQTDDDVPLSEEGFPV